MDNEPEEYAEGELVPLGHDAIFLMSGLHPLADVITGERRELALALRQCFGSLNISVRRYSVLHNYSASSVSRYLSGETVPPQRFIAVLIDEVGKERGHPMSHEARSRLTGLQRVALKVASPRAWKVQDLEDQLASALQEKAVARTQADAVAKTLLEYRDRVVDLESERMALTQEADRNRTAAVEVDVLRHEQQRIRADREALLRRVAELEQALDSAERRVAQAEQRCSELEHTLLTADQAAAAEEQLDRVRAGDALARSQAELLELQREVERLRQRSQAASTDLDARSSSPLRDNVLNTTIVSSSLSRPWAVWIAQCLETHGHRATMQRWAISDDTTVEGYLADLLLARGQVLLVLDDRFFQVGQRAADEWNEALRGFVAAHADRFAAVSITNRSLPPAAALLEPASLWGIAEQEAEDRLLRRLAVQARRAAERRAPKGSFVRFPDTPPDIWGEVPRRNHRFTGRDDLLTELQERLVDAERGKAACTLLGMSGIGKTQIAAEYAHRFSLDYDVVWWVNSDDRDVQRDRFGELAAELGLATGSEPGERIRAVREALRRGGPHSRWLVVFDGWDDTDGAGVLLPQGPGHVLITSRNRGWGDHTDILEVPSFDRAESTGYLMRRAPHITAPEADEVAAEFGDVPLPLVQAAAWLGESGMEVPEYLRMVRDGLPSTVGQPTSGDGFPNASLTSWSTLINRLRRAQPQAIDVLSLCASFAPGRIPLGIVRAYPQADLPEDLRWMVTDLPAWNRALDTLVTYSVLTRDARGPAGELGPHQDSVHMHRLVHKIIAELTDGEHRVAHRRAVRSLLAAADPGDPLDSRNWSRYADLLPHLEPSEALTSRDFRVQTTVLNCLRYCETSGDVQAGTHLADKVRATWSGFMSPLAQPQLVLSLEQGAILRSRGEFHDAHDLHTALHERLTGAAPRNKKAIALCENALAGDLRHLGHYSDAETLQRDVLARTASLLGYTDPVTLAARRNLGAALQANGHYQEAHDHLAAALAQSERVLGRRHRHTLEASMAVARSLRLLGEYHQALIRQQATTRLHIEVLGRTHPQTLKARAELEQCRLHAGGPKEDIAASMATLLDEMEQAFGRAHFVTLSLINDYGNLLRETGDLDHARELIHEAEAGYRALLGPAHPIATGMVASTGLNRHAGKGQTVRERGDALSMLEAALAGLSSSLGPDHPWVLGCALNAAAARNVNGRVREALELSGDTWRRARQSLDATHPLTLACQFGYAIDLRDHGQDEEASKLEEEVQLALVRTLGSLHPHTLSALQGNRPHWDFEASIG
ncbi:FxSxx-COOH system tetratricopeptide repeat protein [Streptomyces sp. NPDC094032]|uniref:FxSxx-COOH system tetratricopeptide repeat protein n=1 Tax=Streptomyces sp. NPDC094032 TaxID=3155308 RepID=UPI00331881E3